MKLLLKKYKWECITAALCGSVCLAMLAPLFAGDWAEWWQRRGVGADARVEISQALTGRILMRGSSARDAVESRLRRIRDAVAEVEGLEIEPSELSGIAPKIVSAPPEQAARIYRLLKSFYAADLHDADLHGLDFRGINLNHVDFTNANLAGVQFDGAIMGGACFANADLTGVRFGVRPEFVPDDKWPAGGDAPGARFHECNLENEILGGKLTGASFKGANLRGAKFRLWKCERLDLRGADLTGAAIEISPSAVPDASQDWDSGVFYTTVQYDGETRVEGLRLAGVSDPGAPFVQWALARGAVLVELPPAAEIESAAPAEGPPEVTPPS